MITKPNIIEAFIPASRPNNPERAMLSPVFITVHDTANTEPGAGALSHKNYMLTTEKQVSWHFTVDDKDIVQHLPFTASGWHCGDGAEGYGNLHSIGIEICENPDGDRAAAEQNAIHLIAWLMQDQSIPIDRVVPHQKWINKYCPHIILPRWGQFVAAVNAYYLQGQQRFTDIAGHWAENDILLVSSPEMKLMSGIGNGLFAPDQMLTRGEAAALLVRLLTYMKR